MYRIKTNSHLLLFALFLLSSCGGNDKKEQPAAGTANKPQALKVDVMIVQPTTIIDNVEASGTLLPFETADLHPESSGRIINLYIREGAHVSKGTLLAKMYDDDLQGQLRKQKVLLATAEKTVERYEQLLKINGISQQEYDLAVLQVNNIKSDIHIIERNIAKTELKAPFSGKLGLKNVSEGAYVTPASVLVTIAEVNQLKLQFSIPEKYAALVKVGQPVSFGIEGSPKKFTANVMATEVSIQEDTRNLSVRAVVKANDAALVPGAFAKIKMELGKNNNALMVPSESIMPQGRKKLVYLFHNETAAATEITTGVRDSSNVEVVSGLKAGDSVITSGLLFLKPNSPVKLNIKN